MVNLLRRLFPRPADSAVKIPASARFVVDRSLVSRQLREAEKHPVNGIRPVLIEDQPDSFVKPLDYGELGVIE